MKMLLIHLATAMLTFLACAIFEMLLHWLEHIKCLGFFYNWHEKHHESYPLTGETGATAQFKNQRYGSVYFPLWVAFPTLGTMIAIGWAVSRWINTPSTFWTSAAISTTYYWAYQYVHNCIHVTVDHPLVNLGVFRWLERYHKVHHGLKVGGKTSHVCVLFPPLEILINFLLKKAGGAIGDLIASFAHRVRRAASR